MKKPWTIGCGAALLTAVLLTGLGGARGEEGPSPPDGPPVVVGLDADMSSGSAESGEAIRRGLVLAAEEINGRGGVLGRPLKLEVRDHRGNPARGIDNVKELGRRDDVVAVVGGLHTPVALAELEAIHALGLPYLVPWAAGTPVVDNGYEPNFVFRASVRDEYAGGFLVNEIARMGYRRPALLLEQTGWGRSNHRAMTEALAVHDLEPATVQWFHWGSPSLMPQLEAAVASGADVVLLTANAPEGVAAVRSMSEMSPEKRLPVVSHWGITGGDFYARARESLRKVRLVFLQTFSFLDPPFPDRARRVADAYVEAFPPARGPRDIFSPVGTAHAYDLLHLLALAVEKAGTTDRAAVRDALEKIDRYPGLVRDYEPPFTPERHDALDTSDFRLARYDENGVIVPLDDLP